LELRHCETLEEVLRRVQFRTLDLEATRLDEEVIDVTLVYSYIFIPTYILLQSAVALFDMVEYYESCTRLNISYNRNIGVRGWQSCARMLKKVRLFETSWLKVERCDISCYRHPV
jgi:protein phosphatase 1 regulatory subunit 37